MLPYTGIVRIGKRDAVRGVSIGNGERRFHDSSQFVAIVQLDDTGHLVGKISSILILIVPLLADETVRCLIKCRRPSSSVIVSYDHRHSGVASRYGRPAF